MRMLIFRSPECVFMVLVYVDYKCVHELACLEIQSVIEKRGGYILHIDATVEEDSDCIFVGIDGVNGCVLRVPPRFVRKVLIRQ